MSKVQDMFKLAEEGLKPREIAKKLNVSVRYVYQVFQEFQFDYKKYKKPEKPETAGGLPVFPKYFLKCYRTRE